MQELTQKEKAFVGFSFDGDADRVIASDEKGRQLDGDNIIAASALCLKKEGRLNNNKAVLTIMANLGCINYLKENGVTVLGIGDTPYDNLLPELKDALTEYFWLPDMTDYDAVYRATACLIHHHGKIQEVRSNNEFWLITEAKLRTDFNMNGIRYPAIMDHKQKSRMKAFFKKAGVDCAEYCLPETFEDGKAFTDKHGFPVVVKPDDGVGACDTYTLHNEAEMAEFFAHKPNVPYVSRMS